MISKLSRSLFQKGVLAAGVLVTVVIAVQAILNPAAMMKSGFGIDIITSSGYNEIRAQYGGFFLAVSLVCILCILGRVPVKAGLAILGVVFGGVLFGRFLSLLFDGFAVFSNYTAVLKFLFLLDGAGLILTLVALAL